MSCNGACLRIEQGSVAPRLPEEQGDIAEDVSIGSAVRATAEHLRVFRHIGMSYAISSKRS